jgi:hypothetical protein
VAEWSDAFAELIAKRHSDWAGRLDAEIAAHAPQADAAGLAIARAWVAAI